MIVTLLFPSNIYAKSVNNEKNYANVVFFTYFNGDLEGKKYMEDNYKTIMEYYNGSSETSVKNYLENISYNNFHLYNLFPQINDSTFIPIELSITEDYANNSNYDSIIISDVLKKYPNVSGTIDYDNDGIVDNLTIILRNKADNAGSNSSLVSHKSDYPGGNDITLSNKSLGTYNMLNTYSIRNTKSSVIIHEFMHSLGYPDLYNSNNDYPVFTWDIMGNVISPPPYSLAYLRSYFTNWLSIDEITKSGTITLNTQDNKDGNQAYIIKSPLNDYEFFVVEYRKKPTLFDKIDRSISNSGVIVYRINTTITGLSNKFGSYGVYVYRDNSFALNSTPSSAVYNTVFSKELGRTTVGNSDLNSKDKALLYSDGTNSGIVLSEIGSSSSNSITLNVSIPNKGDLDVWNELKYDDINKNSGYKVQTSIEMNNKIYVGLITNNKLYTTVYDNGNWSTISNGTNIVIGDVSPSTMEFKIINNKLYLIYGCWNKIGVYSLENNIWKKRAEYNYSTGYMSTEVINNELYIANMYDNNNAELLKYKDDNITKVTNYYSGSFVGDPKVLSINNKIYLMVRESSTKKIKIYEYSNNILKEINNDILVNSYDAKDLNNKIIIAGKNTGDIELYEFDGTNFKKKTETIPYNLPQLFKSQGNLYLRTIKDPTDIYSNDNVLMVYSLSDKVTMEGNNIASGVNADYSGIFSIGNRLYISYIKDDITHIKYKESNNSLLSLSITSPNKTTYTVGDNVDLTGLKVIANYTKNRKELSNNEYTITNFNTNKVGSYSATITYEGISNTFNYEVIEKVILNPLKSINLNKTSGTKYIGETENLTVIYNPSNTTDNKNVTWTSSNNNVASINNGVVTAKGIGNAIITAKVGSLTASYKITVIKHDNPVIVKANTLTYNGKEQELITVSNIKGNICYSYNPISSCSTNESIPKKINAGEYTVYYFVSGDNNYNSKSGSIKVNINKKVITKPISSSDKTYNGTIQNSNIVKPDGVSIKNGSIESATNVGKYNITYILDQNHIWNDGSNNDVTVIWKINPYNINNALVNGVSDKVYNGNNIVQDNINVTVPIPSGKTSNPTYNVTYKDNLNSGVATMIITGTGNYTGTKNVTFKINKANNPVIVKANTLIYNGKEQELITVSNIKGNICYSYNPISSCLKNESIPKKINAGEYTVYYYVSGDNNYNSKSGSIKVNINKKSGSISYLNKSITKTQGDQAFTNVLTKTGDGIINYSSSNNKVATIDKNGKVTILSSGNTVIKAIVIDGENYFYNIKEASYTLTVNKKIINIPITSISLNKTSGTKYIGETENLVVSYNPSNTTDNKSIIWTTSNSKVATINNGVVKAVGVGNAVITAKVMNKTATYNITVKKKENRPITYKYTYDSSKKIIYKLNNNININTFKNNLNYNPIIKSNNNILKDNDLIRTNMTITYTDDEGNVQIYNTSVLGDVNGDGNINALDYVKIKNHIMNTKKILKDVFILSADYNNDGKISALDYVRIKNYIMNGGK
jgi:hypothetical protein